VNTRSWRGLDQGLHDAPLLGPVTGGPGKIRNWFRKPTLTVEELRAIRFRKRMGWGKKVACHAYGGEGLQRALDGGCDSIEHGLQLDRRAGGADEPGKARGCVPP